MSNIFDVLEGRMEQIFEAGRTASPLAFKKVAKVAVREMKKNTTKVSGGKYAPTLYTILVSPADDRAMALVYPRICSELADFLSHEAQNEGLTMLGAPVVRMISDAAIPSGKSDVIAEVVPPEILAELRREEDDYVRSRGGRVARPQAAPAPAAERRAKPMVAVPAPTAPATPQQPAPRPAAPERPVATSEACELHDPKTGQSWRVDKPTVIGREGGSADLLLADTNVSRRHAQIERASDGWTITDLKSTNGTRVNGQRIASACALHDGDVLTLGLIELTFKEL